MRLRRGFGQIVERTCGKLLSGINCMFVAEIADDSMCLASTPWGSSSSNLRDMVHERLLQTKTHEGSSSKARNYS